MIRNCDLEKLYCIFFVVKENSSFQMSYDYEEKQCVLFSMSKRHSSNNDLCSSSPLSHISCPTQLLVSLLHSAWPPYYYSNAWGLSLPQVLCPCSSLCLWMLLFKIAIWSTTSTFRFGIYTHLFKCGSSACSLHYSQSLCGSKNKIQSYKKGFCSVFSLSFTVIHSYGSIFSRCSQVESD